jgi:hypothetical protein
MAFIPQDIITAWNIFLFLSSYKPHIEVLKPIIYIFSNYKSNNMYTEQKCYFYSLRTNVRIYSYFFILTY